MSLQKFWSRRKAQECINKPVKKNFLEKNEAPTMLKKKTASGKSEAIFSVCLSDTPVILTGRTDDRTKSRFVRPSAEKKLYIPCSVGNSLST